MIAAMPPGDETAGPSKADRREWAQRFHDATAGSERHRWPCDYGTHAIPARRPQHSTSRSRSELIGNECAGHHLALHSLEGLSTAGENFISGDTRALRMKVEYDHTDPRPDEALKCHVEAERVGFRGFAAME